MYITLYTDILVISREVSILAADKKYQYIKDFNKEKYDRLSLYLPQGSKERISEALKDTGVSVNEYIGLLVSNDLAGGKSSILSDKPSFTDEQKEQLKKWQIPAKYFEMIESLSYSKGEGHKIVLKNGYINDATKSRVILCKTTGSLRRLISHSHAGTLKESTYFEPDIYSGHSLSKEQAEQLYKWQIPLKYYPMIKDFEYTKKTGYLVKLKKGYISTITNANHFKADKLSELRHAFISVKKK